MVVADPVSELVGLVCAMGDPAPAEADPVVARQAELIRRRFGLALPPPFAGSASGDHPVRVATPEDGAAVASVKWRVFGTDYRGGVLPDRFVDTREVVPPASFWVGRAMVPPSRRHRLLVWGRPGVVYGYIDCGPAHADDVDPDPGPGGTAPTAGVDRVDEVGEVGEVWELYVDPTARGMGGGARLLEEASNWLRSVGLHHLQLSVLQTNTAAQRFYESQGWRPTGGSRHVDLGVVEFHELRYSKTTPPS